VIQTPWADVLKPWPVWAWKLMARAQPLNTSRCDWPLQKPPCGFDHAFHRLDRSGVQPCGLQPCLSPQSPPHWRAGFFVGSMPSALRPWEAVMASSFVSAPSANPLGVALGVHRRWLPATAPNWIWRPFRRKRIAQTGPKQGSPRPARRTTGSRFLSGLLRWGDPGKRPIAMLVRQQGSTVPPRLQRHGGGFRPSMPMTTYQDEVRASRPAAGVGTVLSARKATAGAAGAIAKATARRTPGKRK